jgi:broad specificity phosphatase PhoE
MQLILLRHGQPLRREGNDEANPPLTELGHRQAEILSSHLARERPQILISSPLMRARQTAVPTQKRLGIPLLIEDAVAEVDAEGAQYVHVEDLRTAGGETWAQFLRDPIATLGGDEASFRSRVLNGFDSILKSNSEQGCVAVFTHGFPINILLAHILGIDEITRFLPAHGSITRISGRSIDNLSIVSVNETAHFPMERT